MERTGRVPRLLTLIAFTFALAAFGFVGFAIGPAIVGFALAMSRTHRDIQKEREEQALAVAQSRSRSRASTGGDDTRRSEQGSVTEILIAPFMDVGLTPTFATIAGFPCDVGSAISHGAVVAREFRIPAVVNLRNATATFRTGDLVELDADNGVLRRIAED